MHQLLRFLIACCALCTTLAHAQMPANLLAYSRSSAFEYYPGTGLLKSEVVEPGSASCLNTSYTYDAYGNKTGATTSNCGSGGNAAFAARSSATVYASFATIVGGQSVNVPAGTLPTSSSNALGHVENKQYDPRFGVLTTLTGPNALTTTVEVDDFGRTVREIRADNTSTVIAYCYLPERNITDLSSNSANCPAAGREEWTVEAISFVHSESRDRNGVKNGPFSRVYMDKAGRKVRTVTEAYDGATQPGGTARLVVQDTVYNAQGVAVLSTQPYFLDSMSSTSGGSGDFGATRTEYDALGRAVEVYTSDPLGKQGVISFGGRMLTAAKNSVIYNGLEVSYFNDLGQKRTEQKNIDGKVVLVTDALGAQVARKYDAFGNLIQTRDALQNVIFVEYDIRGRKKVVNDPDTGYWTYDYNALGELVWQQSPNQRALNQATTMEYDLLGRMTRRSEAEYTSYWRYDSYADGSACAKGIGKLCATSTSNGISRRIAYDSLGRPVNTRTDVTGGPSFASGVRYDDNGRLSSQIYPTGVQVNYQYTAKGFLSSMTLAQPANIAPLPGPGGAAPAPGATLPAGSLLWQGQFYNAWGKAEQQLYGNNVTARADFEPFVGRIRSSTAAAAGAGAAILNYAYVWDSLNHLVQRTDANGDGITGSVSDEYGYDEIGRLSSYRVSAPSVQGLERKVTLQYNALGSVLYKSDVGNYSYPAQGPGVVRPHALQTVSGAVPASYTYDANGNLTGASAGSYRKISYTSFNLPDGQNGLEGPNGYPRYSWQYDENHQRIKETRVSGSGTRITWMLHPDNAGGLAFESEQNGGAISNRHYLSVGGISVGVLVTTGNLPLLGGGMEPYIPNGLAIAKLEYWHFDMQGSLVTTTDHNGTITARYSYDPFGKRRMAGGSYDASGKLVYDWNNTSSGTDRGYTGHEHLDDVGLIHMNGRIFDPRLGMFMQGDPFIQDPMNLQNYNRYSYCYNNPMTCTDPSGYLFGGMFKVGFIDNLWNKHVKPYAPIIASIAISVYLPGSTFFTAIDVSNKVAQAAITGFISGSVASGNLKGGLQGAFTAGMFAGAGNIIAGGNFLAGGGSALTAWTSVPAGIALHGIVGCVTSSVTGGSCGSGALSAAFSKGVLEISGPMIKNDLLAGVVIGSIAGGTGSILGGGKFANGAVTGAFSYLFNYCMHDGKCYTTAAERELLGKKDFTNYYKLACSGNDTYACQAGDIAAGKSIPAVATTMRLIYYGADNGVALMPDQMNDIRYKLALGYADYLGDLPETAKKPSAMSIAKFHWSVFDTYNIPPRAFGGTPLGIMTPMGTMFEKKYPIFVGGGTGWCPDCAP